MEAKPIILDMSDGKCYLVHNKEQELHIIWRVRGGYLRFIHLNLGSNEDEEPVPRTPEMNTLVEETHEVFPITLDKYLCLRNMYCAADRCCPEPEDLRS